MTTLTITDVWGTRTYILRGGSGGYPVEWHSEGNDDEYLGPFASRKAAVAWGRSRGIVVE